jgi:carbon-monoxide dehydrogenase large subunit
MLRSPVAHGRVTAIDAGAALAITGVRAVVITAKDIGAVPRIPLRLLPLPGTERFLQLVIAADRVRYVGEPVAVVLGDSPAIVTQLDASTLHKITGFTAFVEPSWRPLLRSL